MLQRMREAGLVWPTLASLAGLAVLISLGTWQLQRKAWKEDLIARLGAAAQAEPVALRTLAPALAAGGERLAEVRFRRVRVVGSLDHAREIHVWSPGRQGPAWSVVTPLILTEPIPADGAAYDLVLVIRGSVPQATKDAATRAAGNPDGIVDIVGRVRLGGRGAFSGAPNTERNEWYDLDWDGMQRFLVSGRTGAYGRAGEGTGVGSRIVPLFLEAEAAAGGQGAPQPRLDALQIPNRHLEYALTWYGLALTLVGVLLAFARSRLARGPSEMSP